MEEMWIGVRVGEDVDKVGRVRLSFVRREERNRVSWLSEAAISSTMFEYSGPPEGLERLTAENLGTLEIVNEVRLGGVVLRVRAGQDRMALPNFDIYHCGLAFASFNV